MTVVALSRRATLFGVASLAAAPAVTRPATVPVADADRRLANMAADICVILDGASFALEPILDEVDQDRRLDRADRLILEMVAIPAVGLAGLLAKAKAYLDSCSYDVLELADLSASLAKDVERVLEARPPVA